ncbi:MAG: hypothetical protein ACE14T_02445 [Syntrophales bacterium]
MVKITTHKKMVSCVFCGRECSIDGRSECEHFVFVKPIFGDSDGREIRYLFHFHSEKELLQKKQKIDP